MPNRLHWIHCYVYFDRYLKRLLINLLMGSLLLEYLIGLIEQNDHFKQPQNCLTGFCSSKCNLVCFYTVGVED